MKHSIALCLLLAATLVQPSHATVAFVNATVVRTLVADQERFGGCMAKLDKILVNFGLDCPGSWVSFSCSGTFTPKDNAYRMFDSAQMAFALGKKVAVQVDDTMKHGGNCYARRIDVLQ